MLHMVDKIKIAIISVFFSLSTVSLGGEQRVDIRFTPTYRGASSQIVGNKILIDLGFLNNNQAYTGANKIDIGTVSVSIRQKQTAGDADPCVLDDLQFDSINISKLKTMTESIKSDEKDYIGGFSKMSLSAGGVNNVRYTGHMVKENEEAFFSDPSCTTATTGSIYTLDYDFKLYAEIPMTQEGVIGVFAKQENTGKELALKDIVIRQILESVGKGATSGRI